MHCTFCQNEMNVCNLQTIKMKMISVFRLVYFQVYNDMDYKYAHDWTPGLAKKTYHKT